MPKICFIHTDTNGLHKSTDNVTTKTLYKFARIIALHYMVGNYSDGKFTELFRKDIILKPNTINFDLNACKIHKITQNEANLKGLDNMNVMTTFEKDIRDINIIVSFNLQFHIKTIQVECFRTSISIDFNKKILVCMGSFGHAHTYPKFVDLINKFKINTAQSLLDQYKDLYIVLYGEYVKGLSHKSVNDNDCCFID